MTTAAPWYYSVYIGQTREDIEDALGSDAFKMTAAQIVEAILGMGYAPDILDPSRKMLPTPGVTTTVQHEDRTFLVSVDDFWGLISVQELAERPIGTSRSVSSMPQWQPLHIQLLGAAHQP